MRTCKSILWISVVALSIRVQAADSGQIAIVSAASFESKVSPDSLAAIFGGNLANATVAAQLTGSGVLPTELGGISVQIGTRKMGLVFVSPTQINFWIPPSVALGSATVQVLNASAGLVASGVVTISATAPGIFTLDCLRANRGAVLNGVSYGLEPFSATTAQNPSVDKRTRLSIFGTGWRAAKGLRVSLVDDAGRTSDLETEYAGPSPGFAGLDQVNVILSRDLDAAGTVTITAAVGSQQSNPVTIDIATNEQVAALTGTWGIRTIAGNGTAGLTGDGSSALQGTLDHPVGLAVDRLSNIYVADTANNAIRIITTDGKITTIAGTGTAGFGGDGKPAIAALLNAPSGVAASPSGEIYIADSGNNRIRKIDARGIISTVAGTGAAGQSGDFGPAGMAQLSDPLDVALDPFFNVLIADAGNNRVRRVTSDGFIAPFSGTGAAGFSGDGGAAGDAQFSWPTSVASTPDGSIYIADGRNFRIRLVAPDGTVRTSIGSGVGGTEAETCAALKAKLDNPVGIALDPLRRVVLSDRVASRIQLVGTDCSVSPIAGTGNAGFSGDLGNAIAAQLNQPRGVAVNAVGDIFVADSQNNRVRQLWIQPVGGAACEQPYSLVFDPQQGISGQTIAGQIRLNCPPPENTAVSLTSSLSIGTLPASVTLPASQMAGSFVITLPPVDKITTVIVSANGTATGKFTILPATMGLDGTWNVRITLSTESVLGGRSLLGTILLGAPAPAGGLVVNLLSSGKAAQVATTVFVPAGQTKAQFLINTAVLDDAKQVTIAATGMGSAVYAVLSIAPGGAAYISSISISPNPAVSNTAAQGIVTLTSPAGPSGETIFLSSDSSEALAPASVFIAPGATSAMFPVQIGAATVPHVALITARGPNTIAGPVAIVTAPVTGSTGVIQQLIFRPDIIPGGSAVTAEVTLAAPAGPGGVTLTFEASSNSALVPTTLFIPAGQQRGTVAISTTLVNEATYVSILAASANTLTAVLTITPTGAGGLMTGTIAGIELSPATLIDGQGTVGTVNLAAPAGPGGVVVALTSDGISATVPVSITMAEGQTSGTFAVTTQLVRDPIIATITATSSNSVTAALMISPLNPGSGTITRVAIDPRSVTGGQPVTGTVTMASPAGPEGILVALESDTLSGSVPSSILIPPGQSSATFALITSPVTGTTPATITATSANTAATALIVTPITAGVGTIATITVVRSSLIDGQGTTGTVTLASPAGPGGVRVRLASDSPELSVPASIFIPRGQSRGTFRVTTGLVDGPITATITAAAANSAPTTLTVTPITAGSGIIAGITVSPSTVIGGQGTTAAVSLASPAGADGTLVVLDSDSLFATVPESITIPQGASSATFAVNTSPVVAQDPVTLTATSANSASTALKVNPLIPVPGNIARVDISPSSVTDGQGATGTVTLSSPAGPGGVLVNLISDTLSALAPVSITIPEAQSSGTFAIITELVTNPETATITATSANIAAAMLTVNPLTAGSGTVVVVTVNPSGVIGGQGATGTVKLAAPAGPGGVLVTLESDGLLASVSDSITIPRGQSTGSFAVITKAVMNSTSVTLTASSANAATVVLAIRPLTAGSGTIAKIAVNPSSVTGGQGATATVNLASPAAAGGTLVELESNSLAAMVPASITIPQGKSSATFEVATSSVVTQAPVTLTATSANSASAALAVRPLTAGPANIAWVAVSPASVTGGQSATGTVTLASPAAPGGVLVTLKTDNQSTFAPDSIIVPQGQSSATFVVITSPVLNQKPVMLTATSANSSTAELTLKPLVPIAGVISGIAIDASSVIDGQGATGTVSLTLPAGPNGVLVSLGSDRQAASVPASITIPDGQSSGTFAVTSSLVTSPTTAAITATSSNSAVAKLTVNPLTAGSESIAGFIISPTTLIDGEGATGTVTLGSPAGPGGALVELESDSIAASVPASITIPEGQTTGAFALTTSLVSILTNPAITATSANSLTAALNIYPLTAGTGTIGGVTVKPSSVAGGQGATGTVTLASPAGAGGVQVELESNSASTVVPASITIPQGQSSGTFSVTTTAVLSSTPVTLTATSDNSSSTLLAVAPLTPVPATIAAIDINPSSVIDGQGASGTVTLSSPAGPAGVLVNLNAGNPAASVPGRIVIPAGQSSGTFPVTTLAVGNSEIANITAISSNSVTAMLTVEPLTAGLGSISKIALSLSSLTGGEGAGGTVTLASPAGAGGVRVALECDSLFASVPDSITIPQGQSSGTFALTTSEVSNQTIAAIIATSSNSATAAVMVKPPSPRSGKISGIIISPSRVTDGQSATGTVNLASPAGPGGVRMELQCDSHFASVPGSITIPQGQASAEFRVTTSAVSSRSMATITAISANSLTATLTVDPLTAGSGTIAGITLSLSSLIGGQPATGTLILSSPAGAGGVLVEFESNSPSSSVASSITIPQGQSSGTFAVTTSVVISQTSATITATSANSSSATLTVNPLTPGFASLASIAINPSSVTDGRGVTATATLSSPARPGGVSVTLATNSALASVPAGITIPSGQTSGTFAVTTGLVTSPTTTTITATSSNSVTAPLTINPLAPSPATVAGLTITPSSVFAGENATGTVTLASLAGAGGVLVALESSSLSVSLPGSITIPQGQSRGTFGLTTSPDTSRTPTTITATSANSSSASLTLLALPVCPTAITVYAFITDFLKGKGVIHVTVMLPEGAPAGGQTIGLTSTIGDANTSVSIAEGQSSGEVTIPVANPGELVHSLVESVFGSCPSVSSSVSLGFRKKDR